MEEERMRDAAWYLEHLERRLLNRDAEEMLVDRLGVDELRWAVDAVRRKPPIVKEAIETVDHWTDQELVLPTGPFLPSLPPEDSSEGFSVEDLKRCARQTQAIQLRNSFGMGVFVGVLYAVIGESGSKESAEFEVSLSHVLELFASSPLSPEDLEDSGSRPWAVCLERHIAQLRGRIPIMQALRPIVKRHGFLRTPDLVLSGFRLRCAKRSMFLAGLIAAGLRPGVLLQAEPETSTDQESSPPRAEMCPKSHSETSMDLFHRTDEELEPLLREETMRDEVTEELEFRLRNNRLSRMLAHLRRISRGEGERSGDDE